MASDEQEKKVEKEAPDAEQVLVIEKEKVSGGGARFVASGELTYVSGTRLVNAVAREIINNQTSKVTVDLRQVTYIDSFGIGCLLKIHNTMKEQRGVTGNLSFVIQGDVYKRVQSTGLTKIMRIVEKP